MGLKACRLATTSFQIASIQEIMLKSYPKLISNQDSLFQKVSYLSYQYLTKLQTFHINPYCTIVWKNELDLKIIHRIRLSPTQKDPKTDY